MKFIAYIEAIDTLLNEFYEKLKVIGNIHKQ